MASLTAEQRVRVPVLRSSWLMTTFVHWRVPVPQIQFLLPAGLTVDEYDGSAWVSLTPFLMADLRPLGVPDRKGSAPAPGGVPVAVGLAGAALNKVARLPYSSWTPETNLRTYVRGPDGRDGLWFLTLEVGNPALAVTIRSLVGAPYHVGRLSVEREADSIHYRGSRVGGPQSYRLVVRPGAHLVATDFEIWLTSRWRAYTRHLGQLLVTPVEHEPWPLQEARLDVLEEDLTDTSGLPRPTESPVVHYSEGVRKVRIGVPRILGRR
jgi:uncharacterized protein